MDTRGAVVQALNQETEVYAWFVNGLLDALLEHPEVRAGFKEAALMQWHSPSVNPAVHAVMQDLMTDNHDESSLEWEEELIWCFFWAWIKRGYSIPQELKKLLVKYGELVAEALEHHWRVGDSFLRTWVELIQARDILDTAEERQLINKYADWFESLEPGQLIRIAINTLSDR